MWVSGNGTNQHINLAEGHVQPAGADSGTMAYVGNGILLYWPGYSYQANWYSDNLFTFNMTSNEWKFISGTLNETYMPPQYGKFRQADASNYPGTRGEFSSISMGSLWIVRGSFDWYTPDQHRDTFVFSVDICQTDLNPCDSNAKCTSYPGYADCACNEGYQGDGYTCNVVASPNAPNGSMTPNSSSSPSSSQTSDAAQLLGAFTIASVMAVMISLI